MDENPFYLFNALSKASKEPHCFFFVNLIILEINILSLRMQNEMHGFEYSYGEQIFVLTHALHKTASLFHYFFCNLLFCIINQELR